MKPTNLYLFFFAAALFSCSTKSNVRPDRLRVSIDSLMQTVPDFSGVVLVADQGKVRYHRAFGLRNREDSIATDTTDIFELASLSKQFTSMIIMMLQEEGKLNYDDSLKQFIPELPYPGITIRHLLTHTSGLPDYQAVMDQYWDKSKIAGNKENIEYLTRYHPPALFKPGSEYKYSNTGYMLLGSIAEKVSGDDFVELVRSRIFKPLQMTSSDIRGMEKKQLPDFARGYLYVPEKQRYVNADSFPQFNYAIWLGNRKGPGRVSSTTGDLLKWDQALYGESLIKQSTLADAFRPMKLTNDSISYYGFAWEIEEETPVGKAVFHTGSNPGYSNEIVRYIDVNKTIILLNNNAHEKKKELMNVLRKLVASERKDQI